MRNWRRSKAQSLKEAASVWGDLANGGHSPGLTQICHGAFQNFAEDRLVKASGRLLLPANTTNLAQLRNFESHPICRGKKRIQVATAGIEKGSGSGFPDEKHFQVN